MPIGTAAAPLNGIRTTLLFASAAFTERRKATITRLIDRSIPACLAAVLTVLPLAAGGETLTETATLAGATFEYKVVLPNGYDPAASYRTVLAFPGAGQAMRNVDRGLDENWRADAERLGVIVVSPAAPEAGLFFQGGDVVFPEFLDLILRNYNVAGNKLHVAGISNGGASAFHVAAAYPEYFWSVTGLPGFLPYLDDRRVEALRELCIYMHVGERDTDWIETMMWQAQEFTEAGAEVGFWVEPRQDHVMDSVAGTGARRLFQHFEDAENGCAR
jgi:poly(3-hydroxybutyrate) depolymerase